MIVAKTAKIGQSGGVHRGVRTKWIGAVCLDIRLRYARILAEHGAMFFAFRPGYCAFAFRLLRLDAENLPRRAFDCTSEQNLQVRGTFRKGKQFHSGSRTAHRFSFCVLSCRSLQPEICMKDL